MNYWALKLTFRAMITFKVNQFRREKIENWVSEFLESDKFSQFSSIEREYAPHLLLRLLVHSCEVRDIDPSELEERDLSQGMAQIKASNEVPASVVQGFPNLCAEFFAFLELQGRLADAEGLGYFFKAMKLSLGKKEPERRAGTKLKRNDPCFCGSGKKYKQCCLKLFGS